jgi:hypothetical protein
MVSPDQPVNATPEQVAQFQERLRATRHSVNNSLAMIVAATELWRLRPQEADRMLAKVVEQTDQISKDLTALATRFEGSFGLAEDTKE